MPPSYVHVVRFTEVDAAGVAFFSRFFEWCHHAWEDALQGALGPWFATMRAEGWGLPMVHAAADFRRPLRLGDRLRVSIVGARVAGEGRRARLRICFDVKGTDDADDVVYARVEHEHAFIELASFRSQAAPEAFIDRLRAFGITVEAEGAKKAGAD